LRENGREIVFFHYLEKNSSKKGAKIRNNPWIISKNRHIFATTYFFSLIFAISKTFFHFFRHFLNYFFLFVFNKSDLYFVTYIKVFLSVFFALTFYLYSFYNIYMTYLIDDCHRAIKDIENNSISLIYVNPPFNTTAQTWDKQPLDWSLLFPEMFRILKEDGVIAIHCSMPFTYDLIRQHKPRYHLSWIKTRPTGHLNAKRMPLRNMEEILIYYKSPSHTYNPQMKGDKITYSKRENPKGTKYYQQQKPYTTNHKGQYPRTFLGVFNNISQKNSPKSVPDEITKYIMLTYSNEGDTILDFTCCDKNNGNIATELGRDYYGIDKSDKYLI